ncbi:hypothetical protein [Streptomyces sp. NBC_00091]|uniref:hypothetical protein n=1 Tax=Streptomyces sp. NBC_00091 TaxID=2975648 RepID=UPI00225538C1|nr:hypothetical protein [Streptomyces sp. NBC_00091]MCX5377624.1 hypothetical protein [Streptomyces sp. NBC_00091]
MTTAYEALLGTDFDGSPTDDPYDVIYDGHDHPRHRDRVPGLVALVADPGGAAGERLMALVALVSWAEPAGFEAVVRAAGDPRATPWYDWSIDRWFSADRSYGLFCEAAAGSRELAEEKGTTALRTETFRALIGLADREGFDDRLGDVLDAEAVRACLPEIRAVIDRGIARIRDGERFHFDVETQLVDLAGSVTRVDEELAVDLLGRLLAHAPSGRALQHAAGPVARCQGPAGRALAARLWDSGNAYVREVLGGREPAGGDFRTDVPAG